MSHRLLLFLAFVFVADATFAQSPIALALQQALDEEYANQNTTGITAAVVFPDSSVWAGTAGMSNPILDEPFRTDHRIGFASITKTYLAALVLQLVEEEVLSLDDTIGDWLAPQHFVNPEITIRQMLNHLSGLYNFTNHPNLLSSAFADLDHHWTPDEIIGSFLSVPVFNPGTGSGYSNTNYILLGMVVKAATGEDLSTLFRNRFLDKNGLTATYLGSEEESTGEIVTTWIDNDGNGSLDDNSMFFEAISFLSLRWVAGGMLSTAEEIAQWAKILFKGDILSPEMRNQMVTFLPISGTGAVWTGYGLGIQEYNLAGTTFWGHSGGTRGASSLMVYAPDYDISIAVAANDNLANHSALVSSLFEAARIAFFPVNTEEFELPAAHPLEMAALYPNPFSSQTQLSFKLEKPSVVTLSIYDLLGRKVETLVESTLNAGTHTFHWDGRNANDQQLPAGVYIYTIESNGHRLSGRIVYRPD